MIEEFKPNNKTFDEELRSYSVGRLGTKEWVRDMLQAGFTDEEITQHLIKRDFWAKRRCRELLEQVRLEYKL